MDLSRYAELFRSESAEHLINIEASLALLRDGGLDTDSTEECIGDLFRSAHTIKGMAAAMGYSTVEQLAHAMESVLDSVRNGTRAADAALVATLTNAADALAGAVDGASAEERGSPPSDEPVTDGTPAFAAAQAPGEKTPAVTKRSAEASVRVDVERLDVLLNLTGELVLVRDALQGGIERGKRSGSLQSVGELGRLIHDASSLITSLQEEVLRLRLVPMHVMFDRFPRLVRELARAEGKDVNFVTEGRDIEVDRSLIEALGDPVVHLLRNAIDHGMETPVERRSKGKSPKGVIRLRARRDRTHVVIQVQDDGKGIDRGAVLERAMAQGLVDADSVSLSDEELLAVIARPGLSTATTVTNVSGRGVGIDAVVHKVRALGGTISLQSRQGEGTSFTLRLPTTLAITRALLVSTGGSSFAFPAASVVEVHALEDLSRISDGRVRIRDDVLPFVELHQLFHLPESPGREQHVVVVDSGDGRRALLVDGITGHQDIVVKRFQSVRNSTGWFSGATLLGDGSPALIVDVRSLA